MTQDEKWKAKYNEVVTFIERNKRNPSKYDAEERGGYYTWLKHNKIGFVSPARRNEAPVCCTAVENVI